MEQTEIASVQNERKKKITQWAKEEIGAWMPVILGRRLRVPRGKCPLG